MADIKDGTESKQKAEYVSHSLIKRGGSDYIQLVYKRMDGDAPGTENTTGAFVSALDEASKTAIKAGGTFVVVKVKQGNFWNLSKVENISTYVEKAPSTFQKKSYGSGSSGTSSSSYNTAGIKVGAVLHDAVALYSAAYEDVKHGGTATDQIKKIAEDLLKLSYELEANVNAGKYAGTTTKATSVAKTTTKAAIVEEDTSLDNIDY